METENEEDLNVDMAEVRKVLEDANMTEPNMSKELMISYYKALTNSKNTASEEDQTRRLNESQEVIKELLDEGENVESTPVEIKEKPFTPKIWTSEKKLSTESALERNNNENIENNILEDIVNDSPKDATKMAFGFNEMVKDSEHTLSIITHELKFVPIQNSDKFLNAGTALKAKMLYAYHTKLNKMKTDLARSSFYPAPLPKITSTTETFPSYSDNDITETYTCRSGRQTKRKNYDEDDDSLDSITSKKVKNSDSEQDWLNKSIQNKNSVRTQKKQESSKISTEVNETESEDKEKKTLQKKETRTPITRRLTNSDIMKRSTIFSGPPKRRCEVLFDKLKEEEEKREKEEKSMELFNKTLEKLDESNEEVSTYEDIITVDDEEFVKKRVTPKIPKKCDNRKRYNAEGLAPLDIKVNSSTQKKVPTAERENEPDEDKDYAVKTQVRRRPPIRKTPSTKSIDSLPSTSKTSSKTTAANSVTCPICGGSFEETKIEEHAATCGDDPVTRSASKISRITCEFCDKVVDFDTSYEVHVKDCISKKKDKD